MSMKVLLLGATGYVGGSVLISLKKSFPDAKFTALVRNSSTFYSDPVIALLKGSSIDIPPPGPARSSSEFELIRAAGAEPVIGSHDDYELVARLSAESDVIVNAADVHNRGLLNALLEGMRRRKVEGRRVSSLVQISGCNFFLNLSEAGKYDPNGKIWTDSEDDTRSITLSMDPDHIDIPLMQASDAGDVHSFIICPSGIYGLGSGPVKRDSLLFRMLVGDMIKRKKSFYVGEGSNKYEFVHIDDLVAMFDKVFGLAVNALRVPPKSSAYARFYISSPISETWKEISQRFGRALYSKGIVSSPEPSSLKYEEAGPYAFMIASNMTTKSIRNSELGLEPKHTKMSQEDFLEQIEAALKGFN